MHELSIAVSLIDLAAEAVQDAGLAGPVHVVRVRVGALSGVVVEALDFAWETAAEGTICEVARLDIEQVPGRVRCQACHTETELDDPPIFACGNCGLPTSVVIAGKELDLMALELEDHTDQSMNQEETHEAPHP